MFDKLFHKSYAGFILYLAFVTSYLTVAQLSEFLLTNEAMYYDFLGDRLSQEAISRLLESRIQYRWLHFLLIIIIYFFRFTLVSVCILIGFILAEIKVKFSLVFKAVILAEFVFFIPSIIKVVYFLFFVETYNLQDLSAFFPYSLAYLLGYTDIEFYLKYPLLVINLFELLYVVSVIIGIQWMSKLDFRPVANSVLLSYGSGLTVWVVLMMFLLLQIS